jgi:hypothetical protein
MKRKSWLSQQFLPTSTQKSHHALLDGTAGSVLTPRAELGEFVGKSSELSTSYNIIDSKANNGLFLSCCLPDLGLAIGQK